MALFGRETEQDQQRAEQWAHWIRQRNPYAIASLVLGVFSLIELGFTVVIGVAGFVLGIVALKQLSRPQPAQPLGHRLAWAGIITSVLSLLIFAIVILKPH
jgi:hypothetical protein